MRRILKVSIGSVRTIPPLLAVVVLGVGGCLNPPADGSDQTTTPAPAAPSTTAVSSDAETACTAAGLTVAAGPVDAAAGLRAVSLSVLNCGSVPVTVEGFPELRLLDEVRVVIDVSVAEELDPINGAPDLAAGPVDLAPGETAQAVLLWRNTVELGRDNTPGTYLGITAVPGIREQVIAVAVDLGTTGELTVGPWRAPA